MVESEINSKLRASGQTASAMVTRTMHNGQPCLKATCTVCNLEYHLRFKNTKFYADSFMDHLAEDRHRKAAANRATQLDGPVDSLTPAERLYQEPQYDALRSRRMLVDKSADLATASLSCKRCGAHIKLKAKQPAAVRAATHANGSSCKLKSDAPAKAKSAAPNSSKQVQRSTLDSFLSLTSNAQPNP